MPDISFSLNLSPEQLLTYYRGHSRHLQVIADDGRRLRFPLEKLRPFITATGVQGRFILHFDDTGKYRNLTRTEP